MAKGLILGIYFVLLFLVCSGKAFAGERLGVWVHGPYGGGYLVRPWRGPHYIIRSPRVVLEPGWRNLCVIPDGGKWVWFRGRWVWMRRWAYVDPSLCP